MSPDIQPSASKKVKLRRELLGLALAASVIVGFIGLGRQIAADTVVPEPPATAAAEAPVHQLTEQEWAALLKHLSNQQEQLAGAQKLLERLNLIVDGIEQAKTPAAIPASVTEAKKEWAEAWSAKTELANTRKQLASLQAELEQLKGKPSQQ